MSDNEVSYAVLNVPKMGYDLAASRTPRLQKTVPAEFSELLSFEVQANEWTVDPENGNPLNTKGETVQQRLERKIKVSSHWLEPVALADEADAIWGSDTPNLTVRGKRLEHLQKFSGSKAAGLVLLHEEAARFGITNPLSLQLGTKPGTERKPVTDKVNLTSNPWSDRWHGTPQEREKRIASIIKGGGTKMADALAKAAGTVVSRPLTRAS